ncbi:MAG: nucleoside phosphorylase [Synergistaceae bacterium]|jgi:uridine phosphorylase|nr:nucleoside phosphorylase [Synergistaceae bacterium]
MSDATPKKIWESNDAARPVMEENLQYHIRCKNGDVGRYVLLPGDPDRVDVIAGEWTESRFVASNREHCTYAGRLGYVPVTCCSTGVGGGSASIALEELAALGADTFIRVGSCGAISEEVECGELIVCSGAMRQDGTSAEYIDLSYPAAAHYEVTTALVEACERLDLPYHVGVSCTTSSFYCGQARPGYNGYTQSFFENRVEDLNRAGVMNFEMEAATIFTLSGIYGFRSGAIFAVVAHRLKNKFRYEGVDRSVLAANEAVRILAEWDAKKAAANKKYWFPGLARRP